MAQLNNFSPLPWYKSEDGQDFRKWWKYGNVFPLYSTDDTIIPSQIVRDELDGYNPSARVGTGAYISGTAIDDSGNLYPKANSGVWAFTGIDYQKAYRIINYIASEYGTVWTALASDDSVLAFGDGPVVDSIPSPCDRLCVMWETPCQLWLLSDSTAPILPTQMDIYTPDGTFVRNAWEYGLWSVKRAGGKDYLVTNIDELANKMAEGQYYFKLTDGTNTWYSDVFTVVKDINPFIKVEWYDDNDFVMDAGRIVYTNPTYHNVLYLPGDIAKPSYDFEEEGETRDGVFYPTKQLSKKKYAFHFLANEPLLDVIRLIRMSDHVVISYYIGGEVVTLYPQTFLVTPEWETEGDVAGVSVEFETDTIAKKVGLAYIREAE